MVRSICRFVCFVFVLLVCFTWWFVDLTETEVFDCVGLIVLNLWVLEVVLCILIL